MRLGTAVCPAFRTVCRPRRRLSTLFRMPPLSTRLRALALYKDLHRLGRDYPDPSYNFHRRIRSLFESNRALTNPDDIENALKLAEYIKKETLALYSLRKYRHLKRMYPDSMSDPS